MKNIHLLAVALTFSLLVACSPGTGFEIEWESNPGAPQTTPGWSFDRDVGNSNPPIPTPPSDVGDTPIRTQPIEPDPTPTDPTLPTPEPIDPGIPIPVDPTDPPVVECRTVELPEAAPLKKIVKCPKQPAERIPRP